MPIISLHKRAIRIIISTPSIGESPLESIQIDNYSYTYMFFTKCFGMTIYPWNRAEGPDYESIT